jgi:hypothetical protein
MKKGRFGQPSADWDGLYYLKGDFREFPGFIQEKE